MKKTFTLAAFSALMLAQPLYVYAEDAPPAPASDKNAAASAQDYVMLKVNGDEIKRSEVEKAWKALFVGHEANLKPLDSVDPKIKMSFLRDYASEHALFKEAEKEGFEDRPDVRDQIETAKHVTVIRAMVIDKTKDAVTDDKLKAAYEAQLKTWAGSHDFDEYTARHILVKTKEEADAIEKKLKAGADFTKLAREKSQDSSSGAKGGELGTFTADKMVPEFSAALAKLKKGEISPPVKSPFGWHIIQLEDMKKGTPPSFDNAKETLKEELGNKAVNEYVQSLMATTKVTEVDPQGHETVVPTPPLAASVPADGAAE